MRGKGGAGEWRGREGERTGVRMEEGGEGGEKGGGSVGPPWSIPAACGHSPMDGTSPIGSRMHQVPSLLSAVNDS